MTKPFFSDAHSARRDGSNNGVSSSRPSLLMKREILLHAIFTIILFARSATSISIPHTTHELNNPCLGRAKVAGVEYYVIGTSHYRSKSAEEVSLLIREIKPDGVVVELDAERTILLTKEQCTNNIIAANGEGETKNEISYGGDFLAAIDVSQELDIPLFLGDEAPKMTMNRLLETATVLESYSPAVLGTFFRSSSASSSQKINFFSVFRSDPLKAQPLLLTLPSIFALLFSIQSYQWENISVNVETFASIFVSLLAASKILNTLIVDRDEIIANSAIRASRVIDSLQKKETVRRRWTFTLDEDRSNPPMKRDAFVKDDDNEGIPIFTLKTPLKLGQNRNLNLFEPRWLHMIDSISNIVGSNSDLKETPYPQFVAVSCPNKFYSCVATNGVEGRYADIIFSKEGRTAALLETKEGRRPISGDRRIRCSIEGGENVVVDEKSVLIKNEGYMVIQERDTNLQDDPVAVVENEELEVKAIKIVVIAGLLHANGIIDRLSESTTVKNI